MARRAGVPVEVIAAQVGHADGGALIFRVYRHVQPDEQIQVGALLDSYLTDTRRTEATSMVAVAR